MIVTRTPFRVTLGGGGTDLPSFYREHGGFILAVAIDKYMYLNVNTPIVDDKIRVKYNQSELVNHVDEVQHTLAREALRHFNVTRGIEIVSIADIPAGTGLGSSSAYLVGLLNALHALTQNPVGPERLAEEACRIELDILKKPIGKQDQYMAAVGGLTTLDITRDGKVQVTRLQLDIEILEVNRSRLKKYGIDLSSYALGLIFSPEVAPSGSGGVPPFNLNTITQGVSTADFYLGVPTAVVNFPSEPSHG